MAELADDAAAIAVNPVVVRDVAGVNARVDQHGLGMIGKELADFFGKRRKAAVEADHHEWRTAGLCLRRIQLL